MATDPPYGVDYDPAWRTRAGLKHDSKKLGKVANDNRADWREAWALFPGTVAYVWHAGRYASTVQDSLAAEGIAPQTRRLGVSLLPLAFAGCNLDYSPQRLDGLHFDCSPRWAPAAARRRA